MTASIRETSEFYRWDALLPARNEAHQQPNSGEDPSSDMRDDYYEFLKWMAMIELNATGNDVMKRYRERMEKADGKERAFGQC